MVFAVAVQTKGLNSFGGGDVAGDRGFEVIDRSKDGPFEALPSELGEEALPASLNCSSWNLI